MRFCQGDGTQPGPACCKPVMAEKGVRGDTRCAGRHVAVAVHVLSPIDVPADLSCCLTGLFSGCEAVLQTLLAEIMLCSLLSPSL